MKTESLKYEACIGALSVAFIFLATFSALTADVQLKAAMGYANLVLCGVFFMDFVRNLWVSQERTRYMLTWGWIDLLSSIPVMGVWGKPLRLLRVIRVFRSIVRVLDNLKAHRREAAITGVGISGGLAAVVGAALVLQAELGVEGANIKTIEDALWWAVVTMTTVGYGDRFPVTLEGRFIAVLLMFVGLALFSIMTATFLSWFTPLSEKENAA